LVDPNAKPATALVTDPDTGQGIEVHPMFPSIALDHKSGNLYAVWIDARFSNFQYNGIAYSMSADGGFTWSKPIQVNQTPNSVAPADRQAWNPTVAVSANGTVAVSYYDFRNNTPAPGALTDYWLATAPAAATNPSNWSEVRLTDTSFNLEQAPTRFNGAFFLGDYEGLAAAGNDFVGVWGMPDGSANAQESIFFRRVFSNDTHTLAPTTTPTLLVTSTPLDSSSSAVTDAVSRWLPGSRATFEGTGCQFLSFSALPPSGPSHANLPPADALQRLWRARTAAADQLFANLVDDLALPGVSLT
jgi:hypothetical protein